MATLMTEFQQQFATVTADITSKICQISTREEGELVGGGVGGWVGRGWSGRANIWDGWRVGNFEIVD